LTTKEKLKANREALSKQTQLELYRQLYKASFFDFVQDAAKVLEPSNTWDWNWHHDYITSELQREIIRITDKKPKTQDLNINVPPRTSKSLIVSVCLNAWTWGCINPYMSFLMISHSEGLAVELASKTKDLLESDWYRELFPNIQIRQDTQAKSNFKNTFGGARVSTSMGASITGFGANVIVIDDSIDANNVSEINLENANRKYRETIYNRLNNPSIDLRVIIGQRVHENDLSGYLRANDGRNKYKNIVLPIELTTDVEPKELAVNYKNGVLWNSRFPVDSFPDLTGSDYVFACQYLMKPSPIGGGILKKDWFKFVDACPNDIPYHLFIDTAQTTDVKNNDPTTILIAGTKENQVFIKDCIEVWLEFPDLLRLIQKVADAKGKVYIEPKSNGKDVVASLKRETLLNVLELPAPKDSKVSRTTAITPILEPGRVKLVRGNWNDGFLEQVSTFPMAKHDGIVDTLVYTVNQLLSNRGTLRWYI